MDEFRALLQQASRSARHVELGKALLLHHGATHAYQLLQECVAQLIAAVSEE